MSMAHKAFLFDTETFHSTIEPVMKACVANPEAARKYICEHYSQFQSPYTGEVLDEDWEDEFDSPTLQVYFDILLTACYDVDDDMGLGYMWDAVNDLIADATFTFFDIPSKYCSALKLFNAGTKKQWLTGKRLAYYSTAPKTTAGA